MKTASYGKKNNKKTKIWLKGFGFHQVVFHMDPQRNIIAVSGKHFWYLFIYLFLQENVPRRLINFESQSNFSVKMIYKKRKRKKWKIDSPLTRLGQAMAVPVPPPCDSSPLSCSLSLFFYLHDLHRPNCNTHWLSPGFAI